MRLLNFFKARLRVFQSKIDILADTFFIDAYLTNSRSKHVYEKAGFSYTGNFIMDGQEIFAGRESFLMKKFRENNEPK
ncbi:MAG: hypothetical protein JWM09_1534 [Francisellaceae bacterium]|nr:hypothetical protein [Francisellaceae bacterium]